MDILSIVVVLCSSFLLVPFSKGQHGQQQREWTQHHCKTMSRACDSLPKGPRGPLGEEGPPGKRGPPGPTEIPGQRGSREFAPRPGTLGVQAPKGERGNLGYSGLRGEPEKVGPEGLKGRKGYDAGLSGKQGRKGTQGGRGPTGDTGLSGESKSGWKTFTWIMDSDQGDGLIKECDFTKKKAYTSLHVVFEGNLQIGLCRRCCKRWYFTFNDVECKQPINALVSGGYRYDYPYHSHGRIEGMCEDILKPDVVRVALHLGNCQGIPGGRIEHINLNVQHNLESRILIREVSPSQKD